jgi:hypothetical protein
LTIDEFENIKNFLGNIRAGMANKATRSHSRENGSPDRNFKNFWSGLKSEKGGDKGEVKGLK